MRLLTQPVLAVWGAAGLLGQLPTEEIWRDYAENVNFAVVPECGHFLAEERPEVLTQHLNPFLE